jgi:hypothetical protein
MTATDSGGTHCTHSRIFFALAPPPWEGGDGLRQPARCHCEFALIGFYFLQIAFNTDRSEHAGTEATQPPCDRLVLIAPCDL